MTKPLSAKRITVVTGAILGLAAVFGLLWTTAKPHLEEQLQENFVTVETQEVLIEKQAEATGKLWTEIEKRTKADRIRDLQIQLDVNTLQQEHLEAVPEAERTPREKIEVRSLIRQRQLLLEQQSELEGQ